MGDLWSIDGAKFIQLKILILKGFQDQRNYDKLRTANHDIEFPRSKVTSNSENPE